MAANGPRSRPEAVQSGRQERYGAPMSWHLGFRFDWPALDAPRLERVMQKLATEYPGAITSRTPESEGTPDPDAAIRAGFGAVANEDGSDEVVWHVGLMHAQTRVWSSIEFTGEEDGCYARVNSATVEKRTSEAFLELFEHLRDVLEGEDE